MKKVITLLTAVVFVLSTGSSLFAQVDPKSSEYKELERLVAEKAKSGKGEDCERYYLKAKEITDQMNSRNYGPSFSNYVLANVLMYRACKDHQ